MITALIPQSETVTIQSVALPILQHEGQRVVTLGMIDQVHQRPEGTARKRFNDNRERFTEGEDYFVRNSDEARGLGVTAPNGLILVSESGYLMLVKSFTDDLAWTVQRQLVNTYFRAQDGVTPIHAVLNNPEELRGVLLNYVEKVIALQGEVAVLTPKAEFHDAVCEAINCQTIQEVAKVLGTGMVRLFRRLRVLGVLMANNLPYQEHINAGRFRVVEKQYKDRRGESHTYTQTLVTGRGLAFIQRRLAEAA